MNRERWCDEMCDRIRFRPDRKAIREEMYAHMDDKLDGLTASGLSVSEAEEAAVAAMGDPEEVGRQLNAVHKPWLGWLWVISKVLVILLVIGALAFVPGMVKDHRAELEKDAEEWMGFREDNMPMNTYCTDLYDLDLTGELYGYRFTVDKAAWWRSESGESIQLYIQMDIRRPLLALKPDREVIGRFYIRDDEGRTMGVFETHPENYDSRVGLYAGNSGYDADRAGKPFLSECLFAFHAFEWEPEWVDLCYEFGGRTMTFRVPGPGGGAS